MSPTVQMIRIAHAHVDGDQIALEAFLGLPERERLLAAGGAQILRELALRRA